MTATLDLTSVLAAPRITTGPFLVATDGSTAADGALRAAALYASRTGASVEIVSVIEPLPVVAPEIQIPVTPELLAERREERLESVRAQVTRLAVGQDSWQVTLADGRPPETLAEHATESHASLVITGIGRHRVIDRLLGDETALKLLRHTHVPVLAVPATFAAIPTRAIVATDFSDGALLAARDAIEMLGENGALYLVHVVTRDAQADAWEAWSADYQRSVTASFDLLKARLSLPSTLTVETITLRGDPAHEILRFAAEVNADLIATGSHGHGFFSRLLLGSVATRLLRGAQCAVLGVPRPAVQEAVDAGPVREAEPPPAELPVFRPAALT